MLGTTKETKGLGAWSRSLVGLGLALCAVGVFVLVGCQAQPSPGPSGPTTCEADADCAAGQICEGGECVAEECAEDADCAADEVCEDGRCVAAPECETDADCGADEECVDGECVAVTPPECTTDADCAVNEECVDGECVAIACDTDADCDDGLFCNGAEVCTNGACVAGTDPCAADEVCDEDTDTCVPPEETFTLTAPTVTDEGDSGTTDFEFTLSRAGGDGDAKTLDWVVTSAGGVGTASVDDFVGGAFPSGTVDFAEGDFADKTITVEVQGDTNVEDDEVFTLTVSETGTDVATTDATITNDDSTADPVVTLPTGAGATVGQNSLITGISVSDADNTTLTVNIVTGDGFMSFNAAPACTAVDGAGNAVTAAGVLKDEYTLTGTIITINQTLAGFQFTSDRSVANPGTDQCAFTATDADGGEGTGTLDIEVGILMDLTAVSDTGANFTGTAGGDVFRATTPTFWGQGDVLIGGDGPDVIEIQAAAAGPYPDADTATFSCTGIETLLVSSTAAGPTFDNFTDVPALETFVYAPSGAHALTIDDAPDALMLNIDTRNGAFGGAVDVDLRNATFGVQSFTVQLLGDSTNPCVVTTLDNGLADVEIVDLVSGSRNGTTVTGQALSTGAGGAIALTTLNISGDQDLNIGTWLNGDAASIDANGFDGDLTVTSYQEAGGSLVGGNGNDTLTGGANAQAIAGGPGNDTITGGAAADQYTGDEGADVFQFAESAAVNTITDFAQATDDLSISQGNTFGGGAVGFARGTGAAGTVTATAAGSTIIQSVAQNAAATPITATTDFVKLTTGVAAQATAQLTFDLAIGTATLTGCTAATIHAGSYYDTTNLRMVVFEVNVGANTTLEATDAILEFVRIPMTAAEYAAFDTNDLSFY